MLALLLLAACAADSAPPASPAATALLADVTAVSVSGADADYQFAVTISSPETGCDRYADWWEVLDPQGALLYRRVLLHSHPTEQPFTRSGGPVTVGATDTLVVRAHMHPGGYGGAALRGSVTGGFASATLEAGWAADVETQAPLPEGCAF